MQRDILTRLICTNALSGALVGLGFGGAVLLADSAGLRGMILTDSAPAAALALLLLGFAGLGTTAMVSSAVMMMEGAKGE
jgi:hypothetical protein